MKQLHEYLGDIDNLTETVEGVKSAYVNPARKNLGVVNLVLLRETVAPVVFRNSEEEITSIEFADGVYVRAVPNKFKYPERSRGLQILRALGVGGRYPQNKTVVPRGGKPSEAFDLNTLVFGDSCMNDRVMYPVKAGVSYSDALSLGPKDKVVGQTTHNRASEDGSLFDPEDKANSEALFNRHFILPGNLLVQVISTRGRVLPPLGLKHLLLAIGFAGCYGGQTSVTGTNIRTHFVGAYAGRFEKAVTSPYELLRAVGGDDVPGDVEEVSGLLNDVLAPHHEVVVGGKDIEIEVGNLIEQFNTPGSDLEREYQEGAGKIGELFDAWFGKVSRPGKDAEKRGAA